MHLDLSVYGIYQLHSKGRYLCRFASSQCVGSTGFSSSSHRLLIIYEKYAGNQPCLQLLFFFSAADHSGICLNEVNECRHEEICAARLLSAYFIRRGLSRSNILLNSSRYGGDNHSANGNWCLGMSRSCSSRRDLILVDIAIANAWKVSI